MFPPHFFLLFKNYQLWTDFETSRSISTHTCSFLLRLISGRTPLSTLPPGRRPVPHPGCLLVLSLSATKSAKSAPSCLLSLKSAFSCFPSSLGPGFSSPSLLLSAPLGGGQKEVTKAQTLSLSHSEPAMAPHCPWGRSPGFSPQPMGPNLVCALLTFPVS